MISAGVYRFTNAATPPPDEVLTLTAPYASNGPPWVDPTAYVGPNPNSDHDGVFGVLMADGAVQFESLTITNRVFQALSTRAGGETEPN